MNPGTPEDSSFLRKAWRDFCRETPKSTCVPGPDILSFVSGYQAGQESITALSTMNQPTHEEIAKELSDILQDHTRSPASSRGPVTAAVNMVDRLAALLKRVQGAPKWTVKVRFENGNESDVAYSTATLREALDKAEVEMEGVTVIGIGEAKP